MSSNNISVREGALMVARGLFIMASASAHAADKFIRRYPYAALGIVIIMAVAFCAYTDISNRTERDAINHRYTMLRLRCDSLESLIR